MNRNADSEISTKQANTRDIKLESAAGERNSSVVILLLSYATCSTRRPGKKPKLAPDTGSAHNARGFCIPKTTREETGVLEHHSVRIMFLSTDLHILIV